MIAAGEEIEGEGHDLGPDAYIVAREFIDAKVEAISADTRLALAQAALLERYDTPAEELGPDELAVFKDAKRIYAGVLTDPY